MEEILDKSSQGKINHSWGITLLTNLVLISILVIFLIWKDTKGRTTLFQDINWIIMLMVYGNMMTTIFSYLIFKKYFKSCVIALSFFIIAYIINLVIALIID